MFGVRLTRSEAGGRGGWEVRWMECYQGTEVIRSFLSPTVL